MGSSSFSFKQDFFTKLLDGNWSSILPPKIFEGFKSWMSRHPGKQTVCRFVFQDSKLKAKFAVHFVCDLERDSSKIHLKGVHLPNQRQFKEAPHLLLTIPQDLRNKPLFCMPQNLLEKLNDAGS